MVKIGDIVAPKTHIGRVVNVTPQEVTVEVVRSDGTLRYVKLTEQQALVRNQTLEQLVDSALVPVNVSK